jgi:PKD domain/FIMAH domain/Bacterial Ig domain
LAVALTALLAVWFGGPVRAADTLDQVAPKPPIVIANSSSLHGARMAQTFRAQQTGQLDRVSLFAGSVIGYIQPTFSIQIWTVDRNAPALANVGATPTFYPKLGAAGSLTWQTFDLSPTVSVTAGHDYAIVVSTSANTFRWGFLNPGDYDDGNLWMCCVVTAWTPTVTADFGFMTYVAGGTPPPPPPPTNHPPSIVATSAQASAFEGTAPTMTGSVIDPDPGDTVSLKATRGTVATTNPGNWLWTGTADDEDVLQPPVTITATDSHGATATATFTVKIDALAPTAVISTGPTLQALTTRLLEGSPISLTGTAWSPDASDRTKGFDLKWTASRDGSTFASGLGATFTFTPDDDGVYTVVLEATDDGGMTGQTSLSLVVENVAPTAQILSFVPSISIPKLILPNEDIAFTGSYKDPGTADTITATWDFGDQTPTASGLTPTHRYAQPGSYLVTLTVSDGDPNGIGIATTTVTVQTPSEALGPIADYVRDLKTLNDGQKNSLIAKLKAASDSLDRGNINAATNQLEAFLSELQVDLKTGKVTADEATKLRLAVNGVLGALGAYNRFMDWWSLGL